VASNSKHAELYAVGAAVLNGTIGVLTRFCLAGGASHHQIAFLKCFLAFLLMFAFSLSDSSRRQTLASQRHRWPAFAVLAFLGVFCLYFFETWGFSEASIPLVSFLTYAAGGVTLALSALFLGEKMNARKATAFVAILAGIFMLFTFEAAVSGSYLGVLLALLGGLGYSLFIFASKFLRMGSGCAQLTWLFGFGSIYLAIPMINSGFALPGAYSLFIIALLVVFPTIGGFYCTIKAIEAGEASKVQIIETSDPLFAAVFGFVAFGEILGVGGSLGAALIVAGLVLAVWPARALRRALAT